MGWQETLHSKAIDLGLDRVKKVASSLLAQRNLPFTLTVGGTNGKGSSVAMLDAILRAQGYRVGCYTSPHLLRYNERIKINGLSLEDGPICEAFARIDQARGETSLSFFEFGTLAALDIFSQSGLDIQILEVGLGGRLDAVNAIDPDAALIATIDIDHRDWFGDKREVIALEKAGILRAGRPAVIGDPAPPASLLEYAKERQIALSLQGQDFSFGKSADAWCWQGFGEPLADLPLPALAGEHQLFNAAAVIQLIRMIGGKRPVSVDSIRTGLETVRLNGRFQFFDGAVPALVDVAHNPQAANSLADYLRTRFAGIKIQAVFAVMRDKDISGIVRPLQPLVEDWHLAPISLPRCASEAELQAALAELNISRVHSGYASPEAAIKSAQAQAGEAGMVLVFGTFPLVSEFLALQPI